MPDRREVFESLYGAWRLAFLDQSGMSYFNLSFEGFWRSFFAAVLVAPAFAVLVAQKLAGRPGPLDLGWATLVQALAYALSWAAFPLAALVLTQLLGLGRNYVALIVALNWATVLQVGVFLAALMVELAAPGSLDGLILLLVTGAILFYQWFVTRAALQSTGGVALLLVLVDLVLNTAINLSAEHLM
jgi:hypothetical protein